MFVHFFFFHFSSPSCTMHIPEGLGTIQLLSVKKHTTCLSFLAEPVCLLALLTERAVNGWADCGLRKCVDQQLNRRTKTQMLPWKHLHCVKEREETEKKIEREVRQTNFIRWEKKTRGFSYCTDSNGILTDFF